MLQVPTMGVRELVERIHGGGRWVALGALVVAFGAPGCARKPAPTVAVASPEVVTAGDPAVGEQVDPHQHGEGKRTKFRETAVYVDGKVVSVMRCSELPASVKPTTMPAIDGLDVARYYRLYDYVEALGVDVAKLRSVQLYGSHSRVATIEGDELARYKDLLVFDYTQQVTGKPRARWYFRGLRNKTYIDQIFAVTIYVDKPAPRFNPHDGLTFEDGTQVEGIPYATEDAPKGTRVYVDGQLAGWVKRKLLTDNLISKDSDKLFPRFSFAAFVQSLGVDTKHAKAIDFVANDDLVARVTSKEWAAEKDAYVFTTPRHAHGKVKAIFPGDKTAGISSVQVFVRTSPPPRHVDPEAFDSIDGSDDPHGDAVGTAGAQPGAKNGRSEELAGEARTVNQDLQPEDE